MPKRNADGSLIFARITAWYYIVYLSLLTVTVKMDIKKNNGVQKNLANFQLSDIKGSGIMMSKTTRRKNINIDIEF